MNDINGFYNLALHPGQASIYYESEKPRFKYSNPIIDSDEIGEIGFMIPTQFIDNKHHGKISKAAARKISRAVDYLTYLVPKRSYYHPGHNRTGNYILNFITLTLSSEQIHTDNEIKSEILQPFLDELRKKWKVISYVWRAEKQKNGSIHFHLITDRFVWWNDLRNMWNFYQQKLGYITRYRDNQMLWHRSGFRFRPELAPKWSRDRQLKAYKDGIRHDWNSPNSTDVHGLKTIFDVRSYLRKYITKSEDIQDIQGRIWGCSYNLTNLKGARTFAHGVICDELDKLVGTKGVKLYKSTYFTVIYFDVKLLSILHLVLLCTLFNEYIRDTFPEYRPPTLFP